MPDETAARLPQDSGKVPIHDANFAGVTFTERVDFAGATFTEAANFADARFTKLANFERATFTGNTLFAGATFTEHANFRGAIFTGIAYFAGARFDLWASFEGARFEEAFFEKVIFTQTADFEGATFTQRASFPHAIFTQTVNFRGATFTQRPNFAGAIFTEEANFESAIFTAGGHFAGATFTLLANFVNSKMKSETFFDNASFPHMPPLFHGAELHEGTTWFGVNWPRSPRTKVEARLTERAYERLKLEMDKLKKHEDELQFFALELQARRVSAGKWSTSQGLAIGIYGCLCDYGRSYSRPIWLLGALSILGTVPFLAHCGLADLRGSLAFSVANTFGILQFRREFFPPSVITDLPWILKIVSGIQTVAGAALFFLFGLGLRNRFRMR